MRNRYLILAARIVFGLIFVVFGLSGLFHFITLPELAPPGMAFITAMIKTGYMWPLLKITEIVAGLMVLTGCWLPLGLVIMAPIVVNIVLFHIFLDPAGLPMGIALLVLMAYLAFIHKGAFQELFCTKCDSAES